MVHLLWANLLWAIRIQHAAQAEQPPLAPCARSYFQATLVAEIQAAKAEGKWSEGLSDLQVRPPRPPLSLEPSPEH
jgi:hypothetical protein